MLTTGLPFPLGASVQASGANFALAAPHATAVTHADRLNQDLLAFVTG